MLLSGALLLLVTKVVSAGDIVACQYVAKDAVSLPVARIDPMMCSHIVFSSVLVDKDTHQVIIEKPERDRAILKDIARLRPRNPDIKLLISLSGSNDDYEAFKEALEQHSRRGVLIGSVIDMLTSFDYDGINLDIDVENPKVKDNLIPFLSELKVALMDVKIITISPCRHPVDAKTLDVTSITKLTDLVFLKSYGYSQPGGNLTQLNQPLFGSSITEESVNLTVSSWVTSGMPANKIVIGMDMTGPTWTLSDAADNGIGAHGSFKGLITVAEICSHLLESFTCTMNQLQLDNYCFNMDKWISIELPQSVEGKAKYIFTRGLAGGMIWNFIYDNHERDCSEKTILTSVLKNALERLEGSKSYVNINE